MKRFTGKKFIAAAAAGALVLSMIPATALAAQTDTTTNGSTATVSSTPPAMPDGQTPGGSGGMGGTPPEVPQGEAPGGMGGANTQSFDFAGTYAGVLIADGEEITSTGESYSATEKDENVALVQNGGTLIIDGGTFEKSGDDTDGDNCNFYGLNSIITAVGEGSTATITGAALSATSVGSNGIFATDGASVTVSDTTIETTADNSRGLDATYGGQITTSGMTITTQGDHCATLATDRGGGTVTVSDSELETNGSGSPIIYSTGDIEVSDVTGSASASQIAGMEGYNTIVIEGSELTSTNTSTTGSDPVANAVIIYQSTSGDAETSTGEEATFTAVDSTLLSTIESGAFFYLTNTTADVTLDNTTLDFDSDAAMLLYAAGNDANNWGTSGSNGATVTLTANGEDLTGDICADTISLADVYLLEGTVWEGAALTEENATSENTAATVSVSVDKDSTWIVTEDCTVADLAVEDGGQIVDADGNAVTIVAGGETVVEGESDVTVTVEGAYSTEVSVESAAAGATVGTAESAGAAEAEAQDDSLTWWTAQIVAHIPA